MFVSTALLPHLSHHSAIFIRCPWPSARVSSESNLRRSQLSASPVTRRNTSDRLSLKIVPQSHIGPSSELKLILSTIVHVASDFLC